MRSDRHEHGFQPVLRRWIDRFIDPRRPIGARKPVSSPKHGVMIFKALSAQFYSNKPNPTGAASQTVSARLWVDGPACSVPLCQRRSRRLGVKEV
jgi:hypothetical protein